MPKRAPPEGWSSLSTIENVSLKGLLWLLIEKCEFWDVRRSFALCRHTQNSAAELALYCFTHHPAVGVHARETSHRRLHHCAHLLHRSRARFTDCFADSLLNLCLRSSLRQITLDDGNFSLLLIA